MCLERKPHGSLSYFLMLYGKHTHGVLGSFFFVSVGSPCNSTYGPNTNLQCFFKFRQIPVNILLGQYFPEIPFLSVSVFNHIIKKYTSCVLIWSGRQDYGNLMVIPLPSFLSVLVSLSASNTCSCTDTILTSTLPNLSDTFLSYISIGDTGITNKPLPCNLITLFKLLLS